MSKNRYHLLQKAWFFYYEQQSTRYEHPEGAPGKGLDTRFCRRKVRPVGELFPAD